MIALDASALLAFLFREQGHEVVASHLEHCCLSTVNLAEVIARFTRDGHDAQTVAARISATSIEIVDFSWWDATQTASLLPLTSSLGLSLGDRACLSLALRRKIPALTADRVWSQLELGIDIRVIR